MGKDSVGLFSNLPEEIIEKLKACSLSRQFAPGEFLVQESEKGSSFFILQEGEVDMLKDGISLGILGRGEVVGESSLINKAFNTSAKAIENVTVMEISVPDLANILKPIEYATLKNAVLEQEIDKISNLNKVASICLRQNFEELKTKENTGLFIAYLLTFLFIYFFVVQAITTFKLNLVSSSIISIPILSLLGISMFQLMKHSGYPMESYGITLKGWQRAHIESALYTIPLILFLIALKWGVITIVPHFHHLSLFHISPALMPKQHVSHLEAAILVIAYAIFVPVQETVFRGAIQSSLERAYIGKNKTRFAILVSNIPYAMIHFHISLILVLFAYLFGLFWGWMYSQQKTLAGPVFSHFVVGLFAFFILGIQDILVI